MNVVIADNPPRLVTVKVLCAAGCCVERLTARLWGDGAALAREYVRCFPLADHAKHALADWLDDNANDLTLPAHLRHLVGQAVRDGCPDAAAGKPLGVAR